MESSIRSRIQFRARQSWMRFVANFAIVCGCCCCCCCCVDSLTSHLHFWMADLATPRTHTHKHTVECSSRTHQSSHAHTHMLTNKPQARQDIPRVHIWYLSRRGLHSLSLVVVVVLVYSLLLDNAEQQKSTKQPTHTHTTLRDSRRANTQGEMQQEYISLSQIKQITTGIDSCLLMMGKGLNQ